MKLILLILIVVVVASVLLFSSVFFSISSSFLISFLLSKFISFSFSFLISHSSYTFKKFFSLYLLLISSILSFNNFISLKYFSLLLYLKQIFKNDINEFLIKNKKLLSSSLYSKNLLKEYLFNVSLFTKEDILFFKLNKFCAQTLNNFSFSSLKFGLCSKFFK